MRSKMRSTSARYRSRLSSPSASSRSFKAGYKSRIVGDVFSLMEDEHNAGHFSLDFTRRLNVKLPSAPKYLPSGQIFLPREKAAKLISELPAGAKCWLNLQPDHHEETSSKISAHIGNRTVIERVRFRFDRRTE